MIPHKSIGSNVPQCCPQTLVNDAVQSPCSVLWWLRVFKYIKGIEMRSILLTNIHLDMSQCSYGLGVPKGQPKHIKSCRSKKILQMCSGQLTKNHLSPETARSGAKVGSLGAHLELFYPVFFVLVPKYYSLTAIVTHNIGVWESYKLSKRCPEMPPRQIAHSPWDPLGRKKSETP